MSFADTIDDGESLRSIYAEPSAASRDKQIDHLDAHCRSFIAHSPFVVVATADAQGRCDVSPKGGPPGFVRVLDEHRLAFGDLSGNNRLDSMQNLLDNPGAAMLFFIPGKDETLRVNGSAFITRDAEVLAACALEGTVPRTALGLKVEEAYIHCAKALRRGSVWRPDHWPDTSDMESIGCMLRDHIRLEGVTAEQVDAYLEQEAQKTLWVSGGRSD